MHLRTSYTVTPIGWFRGGEDEEDDLTEVGEPEGRDCGEPRGGEEQVTTMFQGSG